MGVETIPEEENKVKPNMVVDGQINIKVVLVGDTAVGKTALIENYLYNRFVEKYEPTVLDVFRGVQKVMKKQINLEIHDTSGDENLGANRKMAYQGADCFILCVATDSRVSFDNISKWMAEIQQIEDKKPISLILTKSDLQNVATDPVNFDEIKAKTTEEGLSGNFETSSKVWEDFNVHKAFSKIIHQAYEFKYESK